jgi:PGF-pre-PGF domain-containing protein
VSLLINGSQKATASTGNIAGSGTATPTLSYTTGASDVGDINVTIKTSSDSKSRTVTVNEAAPGGGGGGDDDDDDDAPPIEGVTGAPTNVESVAPTLDEETGRTIAEFQTSENVESIALDTTETVGEIIVSELDPDSQTETPAPGRTVSLQDITVSENARDTSATIRFRISNARLEERGTTAANLRAFRLVDGEWQKLETRVAEETDNGVILEAQTPGFSVFAVSAVEPPEASLSLDPTAVQVGEEITLSGTDSTDADGEIVSYEWSVGGQTLSGETVTTSFDEPGEYTVELVVTDDTGETDTITQTFVVEQAETATPEPDTATPEPDVESPTQEPGGFDPLPVIVVVVVLLLGAGAAIYRFRE